MKIIFLDIDGVLATPKSGWNIDSEKVELLGKILEATNANIVLSSSWRGTNLSDTLKRFCDFKYKDRMIGITPDLSMLPESLNDYEFSMPYKGLEIDAYLNSHPWQYGNYVIIDDFTDILYDQKNNFVHTDTYKGLTEADVEKAMEILNRK